MEKSKQLRLRELLLEALFHGFSLQDWSWEARWT